MILSVSRRTDIPAFYSEWFMNRLKDKYVLVRNPFNFHQLSKIPLTPHNVDCIVFWTKNSKNIHKYLPEIDSLGYKYYFQFTVTPYGQDIEKNVPDKKEIVDTFQCLSSKIGKHKVILRYDPIFLNDGKYTLDFHYKAFEKLCGRLSDYTEKVVISFLDDYKKISKNIKNFNIQEITQDDMESIAENFSQSAEKYGLRLETCAEKIDLSKYNIAHAKCIDGDLIERIINKPIIKTNSKGEELKDGNRQSCGCMKCIDIGQYDTCMHECIYCYASINKDSCHKNFRKYDPLSPLLIENIDDEDRIILRKESDTKSFQKNPTIEDFDNL